MYVSTVSTTLFSVRATNLHTYITSKDTVVINYTISTLGSALEIRLRTRTTNTFQSEAMEDTSARAYVARGSVRS